MSNTIQNRIVNDDELILRLQQGNEWAFQLLVRRFQKKIFSIAFGITLDTQESQDIVQEVFFQVYKNIGNFKGEASLSTWLHRITVNRCLNWKRQWLRRFKRFHSPVTNLDDESAKTPAANLPSPESRMISAQIGQQIEAALKTLPAQARAIFILRELEGLSYAAIAEAIGIKVGTVRSRLFYARQRLKAILEPLVEDE